MRIGQITGEYPPMQGGVGAFTQELGRALIALGHEVFVYTDRRAAPDPSGALHVTAQARGWGIGTLWRVRRWAEARRLDVVNLQYQAAAYGMTPPIHFLPRVLRRPRVVVTFHDLLVPYLFPKAGPLRRRAVLTLARSADGVIVTNAGDEAQLAAERGIARLARIPIGSNIHPAPPPNYQRAAWRAAHGYAPRDFVIGYFGFLNASKGVETLLEAVAALRADGMSAHLLMIGGRTGTSDPTNAAYAAQIEARVTALGLDEVVTWTGFVDDAAVSAHLLAADVVALPYRDGASYRRGSLMAALAHGCAIVSTQPRSDTPDLRDGEHALLVPPDDVQALATALRALAADDALRARLGANARELAQQFAWERIAARTAAFFETLREKRAPFYRLEKE